MKTRTKALLAAALVILVFFSARYLLSVQQYQATVANTVLDHEDAQGIPDGVYIGEYDVQFVYAKVEVTVEGEAITGIKILEHRNGRGTGAEPIVAEIVARQRLDVDAIAGVTSSSTVLKKAVDNALSGAKR